MPPRKISSYNVFQSYLRKKGQSLSTEDLSAAWTLAKRSSDTRKSFDEELDLIRADLVNNSQQETKAALLEKVLSRQDNFGDKFIQEFNTYLKQSGKQAQIDADISRGEYKTPAGKPGRVSAAVPQKTGSGPAGLGNIVEGLLTGDPKVPTSMAGGNLGTLNPLSGQFQKSGELYNAGGGIVDTQTGTDPDLGDVISLGPRSTEVATKTLRPKFPIAGGDAVKGTVVEEETSNVVFEAFSWVPPGNGLGPHNRLDKLNQANDFVRFGVGPLDMPRKHDPENGIKREIPAFQNDMPAPMIVDTVMEDVKTAREQGKAIEKEDRQPTSTIEDGPDMNHAPSSQALPRPRISPFLTVYDNQRTFYPPLTPAGLFLSNTPFHPADGRSAFRSEL